MCKIQRVRILFGDVCKSMIHWYLKQATEVRAET